MDFTREPIIESVVTPKEGCKLVVRSSKSAGQEEFFVDAVEIVSFGGTFFLRSLEKPKAFLVPATDYEILEVREARMVLKNVGLDRSIKIGGGREPVKKAPPEPIAKPEPAEESAAESTKQEPKRRERRRNYRRRRGREGTAVVGDIAEEEKSEGVEIEVQKVGISEASLNLEQEGIGRPVKPVSALLNSLLPPPSTLISESIERYKGNELFKNVFIPKEEKRREEQSKEEHRREQQAHDEEISLNEFEDEATVELEAPLEHGRLFDLDEDLGESILLPEEVEEEPQPEEPPVESF